MITAVSQNNKKCKSVKFDFLSIIHVHYKVPGYHTSYIIPDTCIHPVPVLFDVLRVSLRVVEVGAMETPLFYLSQLAVLKTGYTTKYTR